MKTIVEFFSLTSISPHSLFLSLPITSHGGTIKAAITLALGGQPDKGLAFDIDNCSVTRLDHLASATYTGWRLPMVNQQPWIADASHNAMHQPAGPEVALTEKKLA